MSDKFVFLRQFYDNFRKVTLTTVVLYSLTWSREQLISFHKSEENNFGNFVFPNKILPPLNFESGYGPENHVQNWRRAKAKSEVNSVCTEIFIIHLRPVVQSPSSTNPGLTLDKTCRVNPGLAQIGFWTTDPELEVLSMRNQTTIELSKWKSFETYLFYLLIT